MFVYAVESTLSEDNGHSISLNSSGASPPAPLLQELTSSFTVAFLVLSENVRVSYSGDWMPLANGWGAPWSSRSWDAASLPSSNRLDTSLSASLRGEPCDQGTGMNNS